MIEATEIGLGHFILPVVDTNHAEALYESVIGLRKRFRFGDLWLF